jgi:hypothetical protein
LREKGIGGIAFPTLKPFIKPSIIKVPKEKHAQKERRLILEHFNNKEFNSYEVAELLNISYSGAYKFLAKMVKNEILYCIKSKNNKLMFMRKT